MFITANSVDDLLEIDRSAAENSRLIFDQLGSSAIEEADLAVAIYATVIDVVDRLTNVQAHEDKLTDIADRMGISKQVLGSQISQAAAHGDSTDLAEAREAYKAAKQHLAVKILLQIVARSYRWAITDLRRLRMAPSTGHMRVQVEAVARMFAFQAHQELAHRFLNPHEDGKSLYRAIQKKVNPLLISLGLETPYELGNKAALHPTFASAARGMKIGDGNVEAMDQEVEPDSPYSFHQVLAHYLRTQKVIFRLLPRLLPGLDADARFSEQLEIYEALALRTWDTLERKYAAEIRAAHARAVPPTGAH